MQRIIKYLFWTFIGSCFLFVGWLLLRALVCDQFVIPSDSMSPTLIPGDRILVNKLVVGARIYKKFEFAKGNPLCSFRLPGVRQVRVNDVAVFNVPHGHDRGCIEFCINYVYAKRCIGTPGDSISIKDGYFHNNRYSGSIGNLEQQDDLSKMPDTLIAPNVFFAMPFDKQRFGWTIKNMGPLYVPEMDVYIRFDTLNYKLYKQVVEYETGSELSCKNGLLFLDNKPVTGHRFRNNYYFFCGDNVSDSRDSRYWGFVPEEFIIGVVTRIVYSQNSFTGRHRQDRRWKRVK